MKPEDVPEDLAFLAVTAEIGRRHPTFDADRCAAYAHRWPHLLAGHWTMARAVLAALLPAHERQVREGVAAEYRDAAKAIEDSHGTIADPLDEAIWTGCRSSRHTPMVHDDPRTIAIVAYRHLADRLTATKEDNRG